MATRTTEQQQEANKLISEHYARATPKGLEIPAKNSVLWRYMDAAKLVGMLANKALPMTRVDMFEDRWEGFLDPSENLYHGFLANQHKESDSERFKQG